MVFARITPTEGGSPCTLTLASPPKAAGFWWNGSLLVARQRMWRPRWGSRGRRRIGGGAGTAPRVWQGSGIGRRGRTGHLTGRRLGLRNGSSSCGGLGSWARLVSGRSVGFRRSTVHRVLVRYGLNRLRWMDRSTRRVIRRYEKDHPGELVHVDVKKIGKIPPGGGWWAHGRGNVKPRRVGYTYLHVGVDDHSRLAYVEAHNDETADTTAGFLERAIEWFWERGAVVDAVMTDNGAASSPTSSPSGRLRIASLDRIGRKPTGKHRAVHPHPHGRMRLRPHLPVRASSPPSH